MTKIMSDLETTYLQESKYKIQSFTKFYEV